MCVCVVQRLCKLTQPTDAWLPADDQAKLTVRQQPPTITMTSRGHVTDTDTHRSVGLVGFRRRHDDDDVIDHVTAADKDGGYVNRALDHCDHDDVSPKHDTR